MAKINYTLSKKIKDNQSEIILDIQPQRGVHYRVKSGIYITPANFDRLIKADKILSYDILYNIQTRLLAAMPCDKDTAEEIIKICKGEDDNLISVFETYTEERIIERGLSDGSRELYMSLLAALKSYDRNVGLKQINSKWITGFIAHMCSEGISNRTQSNYYNVFKTFLRHCVERDMIDKDILKYNPKFKVVDNDVVYLTADELHILYTADLTGMSSMKPEIVNAVRDVFVVQCLTGLRYSDMCNIYKDNIQEDEGGKYITLVTKKTMKRIKIYFNSRAQHILELWDYTLPHPKLEVINRWIPKICKHAGITGRVEIVKLIGNKRVSEYKEKWEVIRSHTARRTFITLMLEAGENITTIRSITGHTQLSSFSRYIAVSDKKKASAVKGLDW